jgi:hypothetical protein
VKRRKKAVPRGYTRHHRKPRSYKGGSRDSNISVVLRPKHEAWNTLFDNLPAPNVAELLERYWDMFRDESKTLREMEQTGMSILALLKDLHDLKKVFKGRELAGIVKMLRIYKLSVKKQDAWVLLFDGMSLEEIVAEINKVWIDPDYKLITKVTEVTRIIALS